jgi:hypothetical protein
MQAASLTDDALTAELSRAAGREREATSNFIVHLGEFDRRRLYEEVDLFFGPGKRWTRDRARKEVSTATRSGTGASPQPSG